MNNSKFFSAIIIALSFANTSVSAQEASITTSNNEKIILYNNQPVKVELAGDKILSFVGEVPSSYMEGYDLKVNSEIKSKLTTPIQKVISKESNGNADYAVLSSEKILINYKPGFATLDKAMINKLDEIAALLKAEPSTKVLLTSHLQGNISNESKLSDNRLGASTAYLKIKGISLDRIQSQTQHESDLTNVIVVNYMR